MKEIINMFSLAGDKFMPEMHLKEPEFLYRTCASFSKNKEQKKLKKQKIQDMLIKINQIKLGFNMTRLMEILKIYLEVQLLIKYWVIKQLI